MKLTFRVNASETVIIQKIDIIYVKELVDAKNDDIRLITIITSCGHQFFFECSISDLQIPFTYMCYDNESYVIRPKWMEVVDNKDRLLKIKKKD